MTMTGDQRRAPAQATSQKYYRTHRAQVIAYNRQYQQDHPERGPMWNWSRRKAKKWGDEIGKVDRQAIFDCDQWICQLCREPVDQSLEWPHPLSKSLDHRIPLRLGGPILPRMSNSLTFSIMPVKVLAPAPHQQVKRIDKDAPL